MIDMDFERFYSDMVKAGIAGPMPYTIIPFGAHSMRIVEPTGRHCVGGIGRYPLVILSACFVNA